MSQRPQVWIVLAAPFPFPQGGQVLVMGQAQALVSQGWDVSVLAYPDGVGAWPAGVSRIPVPAWAPSPTRSGPAWGKPALAAGMLAAGLAARARGAPDVFLAHHVEGLAVARALAVSGRARIPVAWVPHTLLGEELGAYLPGWTPQALRSGWIGVGARVDHALPRWPDAVLALSRRAAAQAQAAGACSVTWVPPAVDPEELAGGDGARFRRELGIPSDRPIVLYTGNADRYQDLPDLVAASRAWPWATTVLLTHGASEPMWARVAEGGGSPHLRVVAGASGACLRDALAAADLAVVPRRTCAGFPMKVLHHLAAGHPVVVPQAVAPPIEGVLPAGPGGAAVLAGAVGSLQDPAARASLGASGAAAVGARWTWRARGPQLAAALRETLAHRR